MLALRPIILAFLLLGLPTFVMVLYPIDSPPKFAAVLAMFVIALGLGKGAIVEPLRALLFFRRFASQRGHTFSGDLSHEPVISGEHRGQRFTAGISAHIASPTDRYRTLISSPVQDGIPSGLRIYAQNSPVWTHSHSKRRDVVTGIAEVHEHLTCEGANDDDVRAFLNDLERRETILEFFRKYPETLIHGGEDQLPAEPGGASGVVSVAFWGRVQDAEKLQKTIEDVSAFASQLQQS
jgi:hypothetical protein